ncbi:phage tail protein [Pyxidicoccus xibeiensis]|uniref:phage tail protein n=1 Tax=Pyxidicoccus xibeiensis TaxID=2906759 RepID=UPI0020A731E4|nr:phage tail protein [Pyxidicoccus xibeiensis]MCP3141704.1 phage tail protein [Pyxidicoccus xibeiensis]
MRSPDIQRLLPGVFQRTSLPGSPLAALLEVMEALHAPSEAVLARLEAHFDPRRAPDRFVPFLARWVGMDLPVTTGLGRLRELVAAAVEISRWRGTARGLRLFLTTATGRTDFGVDELVPGPDGRPRPFHVRVRAPAEVASHRLLLERIIEREKPAYVTYELQFTQSSKGGG